MPLKHLNMYNIFIHHIIMRHNNLQYHPQNYVNFQTKKDSEAIFQNLSTDSPESNLHTILKQS